MQLWQCRLLVTARLLYMFRTLLRPSSGVLKTVVADLGHPYLIYIIPIQVVLCYDINVRVLPYVQFVGKDYKPTCIPHGM